jgi:VanZ family protein
VKRLIVAVSELKWKKLWLGMGLGFVLLVVYLSLTPDPLRAPTIDGFKTGHILAYLWLMLWFAQVCTTVPRKLAVAAAFCVMGVALEYVQGTTGYRTFSYTDMWDNALGVAVGFALSFTPMGAALAKFENAWAVRRR